MRLIQFGEKGNEQAGVLDENDDRYDVSSFGEKYDEKFFGSDGPVRLDQWFKINKKNALK